MSTYYYLVCDTHRVRSRVIGGRSSRWWANDDRELEDFLAAHGDCKPSPVLVSEHDDRATDYNKLARTEDT